MSRFLQIQIYNSTNTAVEYDNKIDTDWGIQTASANITRKIMQNELSLGNYFANQFEVRIFGLDVNLDGRKIVVTLDYDNVVYNKLIDSDNNYIIDSDNNNIVTTPSTVSASKKLFTGYIDSSKTDITTSYRDLIAYDRAYTDRTIDIASWWNTYWENNTSVTLATFRTALLSEIGVTVATSGSFVNDNITISNTFSGAVSKLNFGDVFKMVCTLQAICPNINGDGNMEFILLGIHTHDIRNNTEGLNSIWEDYQTDYITGVGVYDTSDELAQLVGTADNVYKICGNVFLLDKTANEITTICTNLLNSISSISYTPATLKLIMSDMSYNLGDIVYTANGYSIIMQDKLSGSLLVEETISSYANGITLSDDVDDMNDSIINGNKIAQIKKDIDAFSIDYADYKRDVASEFQQTADTVVMKVDTSGNIVEVKLGTDPDDSSATVFQVGADNISFIANDTIELTTNNLEINSTNFQVDSTGNLTCVSATMTSADVSGTITADTGDIGGFTLSEWGMESGYSSSGTNVYINSSSQSEAFGNTITFGTSRRYQTGLNLGYNGIIANGWGNNSWSKNILTTISGPSGGTYLQSHLLTVSGTKSRVVDTDDYGDRLLYCYETPTPMFGDIGEGTIADDGKCYVWLDPVFTQTIADTQYQVFLQKYGQGECWVSERTSNYFIVEGTQGLSFGWEIKAKQQGYEQLRLDKEAWIQNEAFNHTSLDILADAYMNNLEIVDYGELAENHIAEIQSEREVV
jgi:hypothetical protein